MWGCLLSGAALVSDQPLGHPDLTSLWLSFCSIGKEGGGGMNMGGNEKRKREILRENEGDEEGGRKEGRKRRERKSWRDKETWLVIHPESNGDSEL